MAEPVLDFQLPDMEVLLKRVKHTFAPLFSEDSDTFAELVFARTCRLCSRRRSSGF